MPSFRALASAVICTVAFSPTVFSLSVQSRSAVTYTGYLVAIDQQFTQGGRYILGHDATKAPGCLTPQIRMPTTTYTFTASDRSVDPTPFAITCSSGCGSGNFWFGVAGTTTDTGVGDPDQVYPRTVTSIDVVTSVAWQQPMNTPWNIAMKAAVWQVDAATQQLHLQWSDTSSGEYLPYIMLNSDGNEVLTFAMTPPTQSGTRKVDLYLTNTILYNGQPGACNTPQVSCAADLVCTPQTQPPHTYKCLPAN